MLVLRRKVGERIIIANVVIVSVLEVEGDRVKLGICAPQDIPVVREEVLREDGKRSQHTKKRRQELG